jgi:hypothetical protein
MSTSSAALGTWWNSAGTETNSSVFRFELSWRSTAYNRPANSSDQGDPAYDWTLPDRAARFARSIGAELEISTKCAPLWAQGANPPPVAAGTKLCIDVGAPQSGSWKPDAIEFGKFGYALATRYDGLHADPLDPGQKLPKVRLYEAWNEPNLKMFLSPQCSHGSILPGGRCSSKGKLVGPSDFVKLLNSFYDGVKAAQPDALVAIGGLSSGSASSQGREIPPQAFLRSVLCLSGTRPPFTASPSCPEKARFDAVGFHPYTFAGTPTTKAASWTDAQLGNTPELRATLDAASALGTIEPAVTKQLWATEFAWITNPPGRIGRTGRAAGISPHLAADYTAETIYRLWSWDVSIASWFQLVDRNAASGVTGTSWPTGLYFSSGSLIDNTAVGAKPGLKAFRFPVFAKRSRGGATAWAISPCRSVDATVTFWAGGGTKWRQVSQAIPAEDGVTQTEIWRIPLRANKVKATASGTDCIAETSRSSSIFSK